MQDIASRIEDGFSDIKVTGEEEGKVGFEMAVDVVTDKNELQKGDDTFLLVERTSIGGVNGRADMHDVSRVSSDLVDKHPAKEGENAEREI